MEEKMFCFQCQETMNNKGCSVIGMCGKTALTARLQDLLIYNTKCLAEVLLKAYDYQINTDKYLDDFICMNLFITITNANFSDSFIKKRIKETIKKTNELRDNFDDNNFLDNSFDEDSKEISILNEENEDVRSLKELIMYGLKGLAAYLHHASVLGFDDHQINVFMQETLVKLTKDLSIDELVALTLTCGEYGVKAMALLDKANTTSYGNPEITTVNIGVNDRPGILVSGHDLKDLEQLLIQSENSGVDIYTHSEMLPAHYYPKFKKYKHFVGNYGNAWWKQNEEFEKFNGPILLTTNCLVPPKASYKDRIYTTGAVGFEGCSYIEEVDGKKDFSKLIEHAKRCASPLEIETGSIVGGFAHNQVHELKDTILENINNGSIKGFVVMAGCDGRHNGRNYYTEFAKALPKDQIILTAGCAKYKYNKLDLGDINGIPRVLDAGQCNDSYSLVKIALELKDALNIDDINDLPIFYNIAWYEQKAVIVLLALLSLNVRNIHLGPTLPAFISENVLKVLIDKFNIQTISSVEEDLKLL